MPKQNENPTKEDVKNEVSVFGKDDNFIRTYSKELHGDKFLDLAKQFAEKVHGKVV